MDKMRLTLTNLQSKINFYNEIDPDILKETSKDDIHYLLSKIAASAPDPITIKESIETVFGEQMLKRISAGQRSVNKETSEEILQI